MKVIKKSSNHMHCTRHLTIIISLVLLFSIFSSLIVPAISAKTEPVLLTKDGSSDTNTISEKISNPPTVTSTEDKSSVQDTTTTQTDTKDTTDNTQESTPTKDSSSEPDASSTEPDNTNSEPATSTTQTETKDTTDSIKAPSSIKDTSTVTNSVKKIASDKSIDTTIKNTIQETNGSSDITGILNNTDTNQISDINKKAIDLNIEDNTTIKKYNFTIINDTSDENTVKHYSSSIGNINPNETVSVNVVDERNEQGSLTVKPHKTKIEKVEFKTAESKGNVELSVKNLKEKPDEVNENMNLSNESKVYEYLDIKLTSNDEYIGETGIHTMSFTFTVTKEWIENESIDIYSVKMMRYHNDSWQVLNTSYVNESDEEIRFKAITPGLSVFAVVGDKVVEDSDNIIVATSSMPLWMPFSIILASTATLGIVLFKKRFVYNP